MTLIPTIHSNGTSQDDLQQLVDNASASVAVAISELAKAAPNARDYYPQGPHAFTAAVAQHQARLAKLEAVNDELFALQVGIADGGATADRPQPQQPMPVWVGVRVEFCEGSDPDTVHLALNSLIGVDMQLVTTAGACRNIEVRDVKTQQGGVLGITFTPMTPDGLDAAGPDEFIAYRDIVSLGVF